MIKNLDHVGIVAGLIDEIGIVAIINEKLGIDCREKVTSGKVLKALLLNSMGMVSRPLYLFSHRQALDLKSRERVTQHHFTYMESIRVNIFRKKKSKIQKKDPY